MPRMEVGHFSRIIRSATEILSARAISGGIGNQSIPVNSVYYKKRSPSIIMVAHKKFGVQPKRGIMVSNAQAQPKWAPTIHPFINEMLLNKWALSARLLSDTDSSTWAGHL